jgi:hypothetical protein
VENVAVGMANVLRPGCVEVVGQLRKELKRRELQSGNFKTILLSRQQLRNGKRDRADLLILRWQIKITNEILPRSKYLSNRKGKWTNCCLQTRKFEISAARLPDLQSLGSAKKEKVDLIISNFLLKEQP